MIVVAEGHPLLMLLGPVGRVGHGNNPPVRKKVDRGMEFAGRQVPVVGENQIAGVKAVYNLIFFIVIAVELGMIALSRLRREGEIKGTVRTESAIPAGIVVFVSLFLRKGVFDAGLVNQTVVIVRELLKEITTHNQIPPAPFKNRSYIQYQYNNFLLFGKMKSTYLKISYLQAFHLH